MLKDRKLNNKYLEDAVRTTNYIHNRLPRSRNKYLMKNYIMKSCTMENSESSNVKFTFIFQNSLTKFLFQEYS